jgi:HAD superfamily hydrolase (TIGR01490 family)
MNRPFAVFDIDGTIFRSSLLLEMTYRAINAGLLPKIMLSEINVKRSAWLRREDSDAYGRYIQQIIDSFIKYIAGVKVDKMRAVAQKTVDELHQHTYVYTRDLLKELKSKNYFLIAITGSPSEIAHEFSKKYDFDVIRSTKYYTKSGAYTGWAQSGERDKQKELKAIIKEHKLAIKDSYAIGDTSSDIGLLEFADKPVAFNPDKKLFLTAQARGWQIVIERKNMIYKMEKVNGSYVLVKTNA